MLSSLFSLALAQPSPVAPQVKITGAIEASAVDQAVRTAMPAMLACYADGGIQGRDSAVTVKFIVGKDGTVTNSTLKHSELGDLGIEACLVDRFAELVLPAPTGGGIAVVSYPFVPTAESRPARATE